VKAHQWYASLHANAGAGRWLTTTARNLSINHIRRYRNRFAFFGNAILEEEPPQNPQDDQWLHEQLELLKQALLDLPAQYRVPLVLFHYEGFEYAEIASKLKISLSKVKSDISRGRTRLKAKIDQMEEADGEAQASCT
jgi:RNA polymerase sigma-70 factor (ECF subfamily)